MKASTEHAQGWTAAALVGVREARILEPDRQAKHDFDEACLKRIAADLRVKGMLVEALEACLAYIPGSDVRSWPPGWRLRDDALTKTKAALAEARREPS